MTQGGGLPRPDCAGADAGSKDLLLTLSFEITQMYESRIMAVDS
jgi:hypothetical protein